MLQSQTDTSSDLYLYKTAIDIVARFGKSKGEGSHGGKVIGHTRSGKPIYLSTDHSHTMFDMAKDGVDITQDWTGSKKGRRQAFKDLFRSALDMHRQHYRDWKVGDHRDAAAAHNTAGEQPLVAGDDPEDYEGTGSDKRTHHFGVEEAHNLMSAALIRRRRLQDAKNSGPIIKSHGEGSHGGHVIGHTRSGKPIYSLRHDMNQVKGGRHALAASHQLIGYLPDDFADAAAAHMQKFVEHRDKMPRRAEKHLKLSRLHAHNATEKGVKADRMQMSGLQSSHANHSSLAAFHLREAEAKRQEDPAEALWHYGQVGLHSNAAISARQGDVS